MQTFLQLIVTSVLACGWVILQLTLPIILTVMRFSSMDMIKLLGVTIDRQLNFNDHVAGIVRKISNQLQVIKRHKKLIDTNSKIKLYNAYFLPQLSYCSIVWNFCGECNSTKLEKLREVCAMFSMILINP